MKRSIYLLNGVIWAVWLVCACSEEKLGPAGGSATPAQVTVVFVRNEAGAAIIHYKISDSNTSYVLAEYESKFGTSRSTKSSRYKDSLIVDGFAQAGDYKVKLYAVSEGEKRSEPLIVDVSPLKPPYLAVSETIHLAATFGGVVVNFENPDTAALKLVLLTKENNTPKLVQTFYVQSKTATLASRGFDNTERQFGVFVRDRFDNYSDTVYTTLKPLYEIQLDKSKFRELNLDGDFNTPNNSSLSRLSNLWDGVTANGTSSDFFATVNGYGFPQTFSFDLGVKANLSRFKYYPRSESGVIYKNSPRYFEIWGSNVANGDWSNWTKLKDCEMIKPSGSPDGEYTSEDVAYIEAGIDFEFPVETAAFRYIRFKTLEVWSAGNIAIYELTFFGSESVD